MSLRKQLAFVSLLALAALAACSDVTAPDSKNFCPVTGSSGTCVTANH